MGFRDLFDPEYDDWAESEAMSAAPDFDDDPPEPYYPGDDNPLWEKEDDIRTR